MFLLANYAKKFTDKEAFYIFDKRIRIRGEGELFERN